MVLTVGGCVQDSSATVNDRIFCPKLTPNVGFDATLKAIGDSLTWIALAVALATIFVGAALWWASADNPQSVFNARKAIISGFLVAFFIGVLPHFITFFVNLGQTWV